MPADGLTSEAVSHTSFVHGGRTIGCPPLSLDPPMGNA